MSCEYDYVSDIYFREFRWFEKILTLSVSVYAIISVILGFVSPSHYIWIPFFGDTAIYSNQFGDSVTEIYRLFMYLPVILGILVSFDSGVFGQEMSSENERCSFVHPVFRIMWGIYSAVVFYRTTWFLILPAFYSGYHLFKIFERNGYTVRMPDFGKVAFLVSFDTLTFIVAILATQVSWGVASSGEYLYPFGRPVKGIGPPFGEWQIYLVWAYVSVVAARFVFWVVIRPEIVLKADFMDTNPRRRGMYVFMVSLKFSPLLLLTTIWWYSNISVVVVLLVLEFIEVIWLVRLFLGPSRIMSPRN